MLQPLLCSRSAVRACALHLLVLCLVLLPAASRAQEGEAPEPSPPPGGARLEEASVESSPPDSASGADSSVATPPAEALRRPLATLRIIPWSLYGAPILAVSVVALPRWELELGGITSSEGWWYLHGRVGPRLALVERSPTTGQGGALHLSALGGARFYSTGAWGPDLTAALDATYWVDHRIGFSLQLAGGLSTGSERRAAGPGSTRGWPWAWPSERQRRNSNCDAHRLGSDRRWLCRRTGAQRSQCRCRW